ncbi:hypothetical protein QBC38DRAFT_518634 [Podospora fimiseda]|uniref:Uncharacterized protein n=1 Tax=Podospora fimiseda TaxID=252190 RepID=A0AAN6YNW1_9PEZI|nr:hypothetical protein QBC38DRAFT_518634 [Podospora fimiseda]
MAKPLMSRLLLENSNNTVGLNEPLYPPQTPVSRLPTQVAGIGQAVQITTPRKKTDLRGHLNNLAIRRQDLSTRRLLFRKVEKAFDEKDFELARLQQENESLKARLEAARPSKRRKVVTDPNSQFASIEQIHRAQIEAGRIEDSSAEESEAEKVGWVHKPRFAKWAEWGLETIHPWLVSLGVFIMVVGNHAASQGTRERHRFRLAGSFIMVICFWGPSFVLTWYWRQVSGKVFDGCSPDKNSRAAVPCITRDYIWGSAGFGPSEQRSSGQHAEPQGDEIELDDIEPPAHNPPAENDALPGTPPRHAAEHPPASQPSASNP